MSRVTVNGLKSEFESVTPLGGLKEPWYVKTIMSSCSTVCLMTLLTTLSCSDEHDTETYVSAYHSLLEGNEEGLMIKTPAEVLAKMSSSKDGRWCRGLTRFLVPLELAIVVSFATSPRSDALQFVVPGDDCYIDVSFSCY